jgi:large subunit ribosomal protein L32e
MKRKFLRQDYYKYRRLGLKWRKPKGSESKLRKSKRGSGLLVKIGYSSPNKGRINNLCPVIVSNPNAVESLDKNKNIVIVSSDVGAKKSFAIFEKAKNLGFKVFNNKKLKRAEKIAKAIEVKKKAEKTKEKPEDKKDEKKKTTEKEKKEEVTEVSKENKESKKEEKK